MIIGKRLAGEIDGTFNRRECHIALGLTQHFKGFSNYPAINHRHQIVAFSRWNKCPGRDDAAIFIDHPYQYFVVRNHMIAFDMSDGLGEQLKAITVEGRGEPMDPLHLTMTLHYRIIIGLINMQPVATAVLGHITGSIGSSQNISQIAGIGDNRNHSDGDANLERLVVPGKTKIPDRQAN